VVKQGTMLNVVDNFGIKSAYCICVYASKNGIGLPGDLALVSVRERDPRKKPQKGELYKGVITHISQLYQRKSGFYVKGSGNHIVILDRRYKIKGHTSWKDPKEPYGKKLFGSVAWEVRTKGYFKVTSLATKLF